MLISVSYLSSYYSQEKTISLIENTDANYLHVDLMDGAFVDTKNFTLPKVITLLKNHQIPLDIHLMVYDPIIYIEELSKLSPRYITFHLEATKDIIKTIEVIKLHHIKVGLAINPDTPLLELMPYLPLIDLVLIMSVKPGYGGQPFLENSPHRFQELLKIRQENHLSFLISMDGGLNSNTINLVKDLDIAVSGSFICQSTDYQAQINKLR